MHIKATQGKKPFYKILYIQVLFAIGLGVVLGHWWPTVAVEMKPLGDGFIKLIKMVIALVIFCTVVSGISGMESMKKSAGWAARLCSILRWFPRWRS